MVATKSSSDPVPLKLRQLGELAVVPADLDRDEEAILGVWQRNLAPRTLEENRRKFDWFYRQCPYGPARCWVLVTRPGNQIVGTAALGPRRMICKGTTILAGHSSDFAVDEAYRFFLPALKLEKALLGSLGREFDFLYTLPNELSRGLLVRAGYVTPWELKRYARLLRLHRYRPCVPLLPTMVWRGLAAIIDFSRQVSAPEKRRRGCGRQVEEVVGFDSRFDALWSRNASRCTLSAERSTEFLTWRYQRCPLQRYRTLGLFSHDKDRLSGYVIFFVEDARRIRVVDFLADDGAETAEVLVAGLVCWARRQPEIGSISCEFAGARAWEDALRRMGFAPRKPEKRLLLRARTDWNAQVLQGWDFTPGDEDLN